MATVLSRNFNFSKEFYMVLHDIMIKNGNYMELTGETFDGLNHGPLTNLKMLFVDGVSRGGSFRG